MPVTHDLCAGDVRIGIDAGSGARAISWTVAGIELLAHRGDDPVEHGMYAMAPWPGRLRGNRIDNAGRSYHMPISYGPWALHGTVGNAPTTITRHHSASTASELTAVVDLGDSWPWTGTCQLDWVLEPHRLTTRITLQATGASFPADAGWHPWFVRSLRNGCRAAWSLAADQMLERGEDSLPTGASIPYDPAAGPFDDAFHVPDGTARIQWDDWLQIDIVNSHPWFVVYDEHPLGLCIEPQSGPPDGVNGLPGYEPSVVRPGEPLVMETSWTLTTAPIINGPRSTRSR